MASGRVFIGDKWDDPPTSKQDPTTIEQRLRVLLAPDRTHFTVGSIPPVSIPEGAFGARFSLPPGAQMVVGDHVDEYVTLPARVHAEWTTSDGHYEIVADQRPGHEDRYNIRLDGGRIDVALDDVSADDVVELLHRLRFLPGSGPNPGPGEGPELAEPGS